MTRLLFCAYCKRVIETQRDGNLIWPVNEARQPIRGAAFAFVHKRCDRAYQRTHPGIWAWDDLAKIRFTA